MQYDSGNDFATGYALGRDTIANNGYGNGGGTTMSRNYC